MRTDIQQLFQKFDEVSVLILGDVMIDRYLYGKIERISPEAPVPVVNLQSAENRLGGAANVALNIKALGATPYLCSVVGKDSYGNMLSNLLPKSNISSKYLYVSKSRKTTVKTRIMASHQHVLRVDEEDTYDLKEQEKDNFLEIIKELLDQKEIDVILFQDYNKGVLSTEVIREVLLEAVKRDIPTVVDPKFHNFWEYKRVTLFKPNLREIAAKIPFTVKAELSYLQQASKYINQQIGNQYSMITLSEKGVFIDEENGKIIPTQKREIVDVCGAGDAVISTIAVSLGSDMSMTEIAHLANLAGGQVCERVGVFPVNREQLIEEYVDYKKKV